MPSPILVCVAVLLLASVARANIPDNSLGGPLLIDCDPGYGLHQVMATYGTDSVTGHGDRVWDWECRKVRIFAPT